MPSRDPTAGWHLQPRRQVCRLLLRRRVPVRAVWGAFQGESGLLRALWSRAQRLSTSTLMSGGRTHQCCHCCTSKNEPTKEVDMFGALGQMTNSSSQEMLPADCCVLYYVTAQGYCLWAEGCGSVNLLLQLLLRPLFNFPGPVQYVQSFQLNSCFPKERRYPTQKAK